MFSAVLKTFAEYFGGVRDSELLQTTVALLERFDLTYNERDAIYDKLVRERPLFFWAALTVHPGPYDVDQRLALFEGYQGIGRDMAARFGNTLPLTNIREWFNDLAAEVWEAIDNMNV